MKSLFEIIYEDGSIYYGNLKTNLWSESPLKKIKCILYLLPSGDKLFLSGYQNYYHMVEVTKDLNGQQKGILNFEFSYIMCKNLNKVNIYKINLKSGEVGFNQVEETDEAITRLNASYWR